ncbi:hypothetical protein [Mycobacterium sp. Lab-001]|uniref:hypothetical protein n=1 Tax=Mycobacterium sp. Lab-001 TaxID=3410136 RepID=UPI003D165C1C
MAELELSAIATAANTDLRHVGGGVSIFPVEDPAQVSGDGVRHQRARSMELNGERNVRRSP